MTDDSCPGLDPIELARYARHVTLPEVGLRGQRRLKASSVLLVGAGGLGAPAGLYLTAAGVGRITIADFDAVDPSNLQRQVLFDTADVGRLKVDAAVERLHALNPHVRIAAADRRVDASNALALVGDHDVVVDGTDNLASRYLLNDACVLARRPYVHGSVYRFEGRVSVLGVDAGPCYRCVYPEPPAPGSIPDCAEGGVLGVLPGIIGSIQAAETIKLLAGIGTPLSGGLLVLDALTMSFREIRIARDPDCPICGRTPTIRTLADGQDACASPAIAGGLPGGEITPRDAAALEAGGEEIQWLDVRSRPEWEVGRLEGALWIPMHEIRDRVAELDRTKRTIVYCHHGARSAAVVRYLADLGFARVENLVGGIDAWSRTVDPGIPRY